MFSDSVSKEGFTWRYNIFTLAWIFDWFAFVLHCFIGLCDCSASFCIYSIVFSCVLYSHPNFLLIHSSFTPSIFLSFYLHTSLYFSITLTIFNLTPKLFNLHWNFQPPFCAYLYSIISGFSYSNPYLDPFLLLVPLPPLVTSIQPMSSYLRSFVLEKALELMGSLF